MTVLLEILCYDSQINQAMVTQFLKTHDTIETRTGGNEHDAFLWTI